METAERNIKYSVLYLVRTKVRISRSITKYYQFAETPSGTLSKSFSDFSFLWRLSGCVVSPELRLEIWRGYTLIYPGRSRILHLPERPSVPWQIDYRKLSE